MAGKIYRDSVGITIEVSTEIDLTDATKYTLEVSKPNGVEDIWTPNIKNDPEDGVLTFTTGENDLDVAGLYKIQAVIEFTDTQYRGETTTFKIFELWE